MSPRHPVTEEETEDHRRRLVEATLVLIGATGTSSPPVEMILRRSGLSRQALYRCFGSKDRLVASVVTEGRRLLADYLAARLSHAPTPEAKLRSWIEGVMRQAKDPEAARRIRPFVAGARQTGLTDPSYFAETEQLLCGPLCDVITLGTVDGTWVSCDPAADAVIIYDLVIGSLQRHLLLNQAPSPAAIALLIDFALRALRNGPAKDRRS